MGMSPILLGPIVRSKIRVPFLGALVPLQLLLPLLVLSFPNPPAIVYFSDSQEAGLRLDQGSASRSALLRVYK